MMPCPLRVSFPVPCSGGPGWVTGVSVSVAKGGAASRRRPSICGRLLGRLVGARESTVSELPGGFLFGHVAECRRRTARNTRRGGPVPGPAGSLDRVPARENPSVLVTSRLTSPCHLKRAHARVASSNSRADSVSFCGTPVLSSPSCTSKKQRRSHPTSGERYIYMYIDVEVKVCAPRGQRDTGLLRLAE